MKARLLDLFCGAGGCGKAIPPAYTEFIGHYLFNAVEARHAA